MDTVTFEDVLALVGSVTTLATALSAVLHWIGPRTATTLDDEAAAFLDGLLAVCGRLGWWPKPKP